MLDIINAEEYFEKTETAVRTLLEGVKGYRDLLLPIRELTWGHGELDDDLKVAEYYAWLDQNVDKFERAEVARRNFRAQSFAMATLCGSLLQIAAKCIDMFSNNQSCEACKQIVFKPGRAVRYCVGRVIKGVPIGLIVYAGRNQHVHCDEEILRDEVNNLVFEHLATVPGYPGYRDPAFDLKARRLDSYASNITALLKWRTYDAYIDDMRMMLHGK